MVLVKIDDSSHDFGHNLGTELNTKMWDRLASYSRPVGSENVEK